MDSREPEPPDESEQAAVSIERRLPTARRHEDSEVQLETVAFLFIHNQVINPRVDPRVVLWVGCSERRTVVVVLVESLPAVVALAEVAFDSVDAIGDPIQDQIQIQRPDWIFLMEPFTASAACVVVVPFHVSVPVSDDGAC